MVFDLARGPQVALNLMDRLDETIKAEKQFIQACLTEIDGASTALVEAAPKKMRDPLLGPWQGLLRGGAMNLPQMDPERERLMEKTVLDAKLRLLTEFAAALAAPRPEHRAAPDLHCRLARPLDSDR